MMGARLRVVASFVAVAVAGGGCSTSYDLTLSSGAPSYGSLGATIPIAVVADDDLDGVALTMSALPSTIVVTPATVTIDANGMGSAYALVPYGVTGAVVASSALATSASIDVSSPPLTFCPPTFTRTAQVNAIGQVHTMSMAVVQGSDCANGEPAPPGVSISVAVTPQSGTTATSVLSTDAAGIVTLNMLVPWGSTVFVLASGAGSAVSTSITGTSNPARVACLQWTKVQGLYQVEARVQYDTAPLPAFPVKFAIVSPSGMVGVVSPVDTTTNSEGKATTYVNVDDPAKLPVVVSATSGTSSLTITLDTSSASALCP